MRPLHFVRICALSLLTTCAGWFAFTATAEAQLYWQNSSHHVFVSGFDGLDPIQLSTSPWPARAIFATDDYVYRLSTANQLYRIDRRGGGRGTSLPPTPIYAAAFDRVEKKIYYTRPSGGGGLYGVWRMNLDGTSPESVWVGPVLANGSGHIAIDPIHRTMYWFIEPEGFGEATLMRAGLDGEDATVVLSDVLNSNQQRIAVDPLHGKIYVRGGIENYSDLIVANLDGSSAVEIQSEDLTPCTDMAVAPRAGRIYFVCSGSILTSDLSAEEFVEMDGPASVGSVTVVEELVPLIEVAAEPAGDACENGGARIRRGTDLNENGTLDAIEVDSAQFLCAGTASEDAPHATLFASSTEPAGENCEVGGARIDSGLDDDDDGTLGASEIDATRFVCGGRAGAAGSAAALSLVASANEPAGTSCARGGARIDVGLDANTSGTLEAGEVTSTSYVCNGTSGSGGPSPLVTTTREEPGERCASGGTRIESGLDADRSGTLDTDEVTATRYVCDGASGTRALVRTSPAADACEFGGTRIESGLDGNGDGELSASEITDTTFACTPTTFRLAGGAGCGVAGNQQNAGAYALGLVMMAGVLTRRNRRRSDVKRAMNGRRVFGLFSAIFGALLAAAPSVANAQLYWSRAGESTLKTGRFNGIDERIILGSTVANGLGTIALTDDYVFWTASHAVAGTQVKRADRRTGGRVTDVGGAGSYWGLAFDPVEQKIYVTETTGVSRMNLDGSEHERVLTRAMPERSRVSIDVVHRTMYYGVNSDRDGYIDIYRANLDGSDPSLVFEEIDPPDNVRLAIDAVHEKLYVLGQPERPHGFTMMDLDGSNAVSMYNFGTFDDIVVLPELNRIYFAGVGADLPSHLGRTISYANLDGTGHADAVNVAANHIGVFLEPSTAQLVDIDDEPAGERCESGGVRVSRGTDANANGELEETEIVATQYVCNGAGGEAPARLATADEPAGENCEYGGVRVDVGVDDDGDEALGEDEVDATHYLCDGGPGEVGAEGHASLIASATEAAGANCAFGGVRIDSGVDDDDDGELEAGEIDATRYLCNGAGANAEASALVATSDEPAGDNCEFGGTRIDVGADTDGDTVLDTSEITSTRYVCGGAAGASALVSVAAEPPGESCVRGGVRIDSGLDEDGDGELEADEIDDTSFVCTPDAIEGEGGCSAAGGAGHSNGLALGLLVTLGALVRRARKHTINNR